MGPAAVNSYFTPHELYFYNHPHTHTHPPHTPTRTYFMRAFETHVKLDITQHVSRIYISTHTHTHTHIPHTHTHTTHTQTHTHTHTTHTHTQHTHAVHVSCCGSCLHPTTHITSCSISTHAYIILDFSRLNGMATFSRIDKIRGLFCKRALSKRLNSAK